MSSGAHLGDRHGPGRNDAGDALAEELDRRDQHQVGQHAARRHGRGDLRADDVADAKSSGEISRATEPPLKGAPKTFSGRVLPELARAPSASL